jgi:hypothetical protein
LLVEGDGKCELDCGRKWLVVAMEAVGLGIDKTLVLDAVGGCSKYPR